MIYGGLEIYQDVPTLYAGWRHERGNMTAVTAMQNPQKLAAMALALGKGMVMNVRLSCGANLAPARSI